MDKIYNINNMYEIEHIIYSYMKWKNNKLKQNVDIFLGYKNCIII